MIKKWASLFSLIFYNFISCYCQLAKSAKKEILSRFSTIVVWFWAQNTDNGQHQTLTCDCFVGHSRYTFAHNLIEHQKSVSIDCYIALADEFSTVYYCCLTALGSVKMLSNKKHSFTVCLFFMIYLPSCHILNCFCSVRTFHWHDTLHFICRCLTSKMDFFKCPLGHVVQRHSRKSLYPSF